MNQKKEFENKKEEVKNNIKNDKTEEDFDNEEVADSYDDVPNNENSYDEDDYDWDSEDDDDINGDA